MVAIGVWVAANSKMQKHHQLRRLSSHFYTTNYAFGRLIDRLLSLFLYNLLIVVLPRSCERGEQDCFGNEVKIYLIHSYLIYAEHLTLSLFNF